MQRTDQATPQVVGDNSVRANAPLIAALQSLYRAYQKTSIYPKGHPAIPEALVEAIGGLETAFGDEAQTLFVGVTRDRLMLADEVLDEGTGALPAMAMLLHDLDVAGICFRRGLQAEELRSFVLFLGRARTENVKGASLVEAIRRERLPHVELNAIDYRALRFDEGPRSAADPGSEKTAWESLNASLTGDAEGRAPSPEQMAEQVCAEIDGGAGDSLGVLRSRIEGVQQAMKGAREDERAAYRRRMAKFVSALSRRLRVDLLRVDPQAPGRSLSSMADLADVMPDADLIEALQQIDQEGARVPGQLMTLMNKLVRLSHGRPSLAAGLEDTLRKWGLNGSILTREPTVLREALEEVFRRRDRHSFNPQPYQDLLDKLSRSRLEGDDVPSLELYRDPQDRADVRMHKAEIAMRLLSAPGGGQYRAALFAQAGSAMDGLLDRRKFDAIRDAAVVARAYSLVKRESNTTRRAAKGYLSSFMDEDRIRRILDGILTDGEAPDPALTLLNLGGVMALGHVLNVLAEDPPPRVAGALRRFAANRGAEDLSRVLKWRFERGWAALCPIFGVIRELDRGDATPLLEKLLDHEDFKVRREALLALLELDDRSGRIERHLLRGLSDDNDKFVNVVIRCLGRLEGPRALDLLAGHLEGRYSRAPQRGSARRAALHLAHKGEPGIERLCKVLDAVSQSLSPAKIQRARMIRVVLAGHRDAEPVREILGRWKRSVAGIVGLVLPPLKPARRRKA